MVAPPRQGSVYPVPTKASSTSWPKIIIPTEKPDPTRIGTILKSSKLESRLIILDRIRMPSPKSLTMVTPGPDASGRRRDLDARLTKLKTLSHPCLLPCLQPKRSKKKALLLRSSRFVLVTTCLLNSARPPTRFAPRSTPC